jgi:hypothetical protein
MEDSKFSAAMAAYAALVSELLNCGALETESIIRRLQIAHANLGEERMTVAHEALGEFLAGAVPAWRMTNTRGLRPS